MLSSLKYYVQELNRYLESERHERVLDRVARILDLDFYASRSQKAHRLLASADRALRARVKRTLVFQHVIREVRARRLRDLLSRAVTLRQVVPRHRSRRRGNQDIAA